MGCRIGAQYPGAALNLKITMKKYHGRSLASFVQDLANQNPSPLSMTIPVPELTVAQVADLDIWSVPRGSRIFITDVPVAGNLILIRTSSALRFNWALPVPVSSPQTDVRRVAESALYGASTARRQSGVKVAGYRSTRHVVFWLPLCRSGREAIERMNAEMVALREEARKLCVEAGTVLAGPASAEGGN